MGYWKTFSSGNTSRKEARELFKNAAKVCSVCGDAQKVYIHHKNKDPLDNNIRNLEMLCSSCHNKKHRKLFKFSIKRRFEEVVYGEYLSNNYSLSDQ